MLKNIGFRRTEPNINNIQLALNSSKPKDKPIPTTIKQYNLYSNQKISKCQYQKYFTDIANIFCLDSQDLRSQTMRSYQKEFKILAIIWTGFLASLFLISMIDPYQGQCPFNAQCKIFVRCAQGFELSSKGLVCQISSSVKSSIQNGIIVEIQKLKEEFGNSECIIEGGGSNVPSIMSINALIPGITRYLPQQSRLQGETVIWKFLNLKENQLKYSFKIENNQVVPREKQYSNQCKWKLASKSPFFKLLCLIVFVSACYAVWKVYEFIQYQKADQIYSYLKLKLGDQFASPRGLNVTLLGDQIRCRFGQLDEPIWIRVNELREKEKRIAVYEDTFLFWKKI